MDRDKAIRYMHDLLRMMVQKDGSDLFITAGAVPSMKVDGVMKPSSDRRPKSRGRPLSSSDFSPRILAPRSAQGVCM